MGLILKTKVVDIVKKVKGFLKNRKLKQITKQNNIKVMALKNDYGMV